MSIYKVSLWLSFFIITMIFSMNVMANVIINGTRIIINEKNKESTVQLRNKGSRPSLLQLWIDDGKINSRPGEIKLPFIITPPVVRVDSGKGQAVRIIATNPALLQNREYLFWFNMLEIPPKAQIQKTGNTHMQLAFRTRIKIFYRPTGLQISPLQSYKELKVTVQGNKIKIVNESPYHITFSKIEIRKSKDSAVLALVDSFPKRMIEPRSEMTLLLINKSSAALTGNSVFYSVINDYGGETINEQKL